MWATFAQVDNAPSSISSRSSRLARARPRHTRFSTRHCAVHARSTTERPIRRRSCSMFRGSAPTSVNTEAQGDASCSTISRTASEVAVAELQTHQRAVVAAAGATSKATVPCEAPAAAGTTEHRHAHQSGARDVPCSRRARLHGLPCLRECIARHRRPSRRRADRVELQLLVRLRDDAGELILRFARLTRMTYGGSDPDSSVRA